MHITKHLHGKTHDRSKVNVGSSIARRQRPEESLVCARVTAGEIPSSFGRVCRTSPSAVWLTLSRFSLRNLTHSFSHSLTHTQTHTLPIHFVLPSPFLTFPLSSFPSSISHSHSFIFPMVYNCSLSLSFSCLPSLFLPFILFPSPSFLPPPPPSLRKPSRGKRVRAEPKTGFAEHDTEVMLHTRAWLSRMRERLT